MRAGCFARRSRRHSGRRVRYRRTSLERCQVVGLEFLVSYNVVASAHNHPTFIINLFDHKI